jgi:hypothetical protein
MADEEPKVKKPPLKPPSDDFCDAFSGHTGSLTMECDFCKRFYFGTDGDYEEGERERYEAAAKTAPDKYISIEGYSHSVEVDGKTWVSGCECNGPRRYEDWIWSNRTQIAAYLQKRNLPLLEDAIRLKVVLDTAVRAHDEIEAFAKAD